MNAKDYKPKLESAVNFYHEDDRATVTNFLNKVIEEKSDFTFEARLVRPSGEVRYVRSSGECTTNEKGKAIAVFGIFQDITEQRKLLEELEESRRHYQLATEAANVGLWDWNVVSGDTYFNDQWYTILGYTPHELPASFDTFEKLCNAEDFQKAMVILNQHMAGGKNQYRIIIRMKHKLGHWLHVLTTGQVIERNSEGEAIRVAGIHIDMTEHVNNEEALKQANSELEEFAYRTSHDLRSPLVSSIGLLSLAQNAIENDDKAQSLKSLELINNSLVKLETLIKDILELTKAKNVDEDCSKISILETFDETLEKLSNIENFNRLNIITDFKFEKDLYLKKSRFNLIFENMISNAIKYQDCDENSSYIKISTYEKNDHFILKIEDNGLGIPEDQTKKMFEMFQRFHSRVSYGSGLGLYMMKKSAAMLGGDLIFEQPPKGAIFKLQIPINKIENPDLNGSNN